MAVPVIESVTTSQENEVTSFTVDMPSTRPDDDLYVAVITKDSNSTIVEDAAWTELGQSTGSGATQSGVFYLVGSSEPASYEFTAATSERWCGTVYRFSGQAASDFIGDYSVNSGTAATVDCPSISTFDEANSLVMRACGLDTDTFVGGGFDNVGAGVTEDSSVSSGDGGGNNSQITGHDDTAADPSGVEGVTFSASDQHVATTYRVTGASGFTGTVTQTLPAVTQSASARTGYFPALMSITNTTESTGSTTFPVNMPSTRPDDNLYVAVVAQDGANPISAPAGWTEIIADGPSANPSGVWYRKGDSEASSYTWSAASTGRWQGSILRFDRAKLHLVENDGSDSDSATNTTATAPTLSTYDEAVSVLLRIATIDRRTVTNWETAGVGTDVSLQSGGTFENSMIIGRDALPADPAGTATATLAASDGWVGYTVALRYSTGYAAQTLPAVTQQATGTTGTTFEGTIGQTLPAVTQQATAELQFIATAAQTLPAINQSATAELKITGTAAQTLPAVTQSATAIESYSGTITQTLPAVTQSATALAGAVGGTISQILPSVTQSATAVLTYSGAIGQTLPSVTQAATALAGNIGTISQTLPAVTQSVTGTTGLYGTITQTLPAVTQSITATTGFPDVTTEVTGEQITTAVGTVVSFGSAIVFATGNNTNTTISLGDALPVTHNILAVTGLSTTTAVGTVTLPLDPDTTPMPEGLEITTGITGVNVWGVIDDSQTPSWATIDTSQTANWVEIDDSQTPNWDEIET